MPRGYPVNRGVLAANRTWHACCCALGQHRFDCAEAETFKRSGGPFLPLKAGQS